MKTLIKGICPLLCLLFACFTVPLTGCKSPTRTLYTVEASANVTVETALRAWNDYLGTHEVSLDQERNVKAAFEKYKAAMIFAVRASQTYASLKSSESQKAADSAYAEAIDSLSALVNLLRSFGVKI